MKLIVFATTGIGLALLFSGSAQGKNASCLEFGPAIVTLSGKITRHMEYGAPGYGEDPAHDEKETYWYLDLDQPICVNGKGDDSPEMEDVEGVNRMQIVFYHGYPGPRRRWVGHRATIIGTLFRSITGHHHTDVLIESQSITRSGN